MPRNLPGARELPPRATGLVDAPRRGGTRSTLTGVRVEAKACRACPLWKPATQTVFGEGPAHAAIMLVGEQPGDQEDLSGRPFVGPAGRMLDRALDEIGVERGTLYLTNAVKHFKFVPRGKTRLHQRANAAEQRACRPWLDAELSLVSPRYVVALGAMAAQALFGRGFKLMAQRGEWQELGPGMRGFATVHPSFLLRQRDSAERERAYREFVEDLAVLKELGVRKRAASSTRRSGA